MKRNIVLFSLLAMALGLHAQQNQHSNYLGLDFGGGLNTLTYKTVDGKYTPGFGFQGGLRYAHFFGKHFGIGFGVQYTQNSASVLYDFTERAEGMTVHPDNVNNIQYTQTTVYRNWRERQTLAYLNIPIELYWRAPLSDKWAFLFGLGASIDLPLFGRYTATEGSYSIEGYFPSLGYTISNLPNHGFRSYDADFNEPVKLSKVGVSVIADLGFNYELCNNWGLYLGLYGGYSVTNLLDSTSTKPLLNINEADASKIDYNGTLASNQIDFLRLLNAGVKIGINLGWDCHASARAAKGDDVELSPYDDATAAASQRKDGEQPSKIENQPATEGEAPAAAPAQDNVAPVAPAEKEASDAPADNEGKGNEPAAGTYGNDAYGNNMYGNNDDEEAAAREARCNARRMNNPDMAQANSDIDNDIAEAEQMAKASGNAAAQEAVEDAKAKAADAKNAYKNGQYCKAYDLFNEAYGDIANSYADDAATYAEGSSSDEAKKAAADADVYADAAHKDGLDCAMAASRNARINAEIARDTENGGRKNSAAYSDPNYADYLASEALAMAEDAGSKPGKTAAKDASGKAYRGNLADSYAASAKSFAASADAYAAQGNNPDAKAAAAEAQRYANEAAEAARMGDVAGAYRAARAAQQAAERARRHATGADAKPADGQNADGQQPASGKPADRAQLQKYLDQINATVHFDFSSTEPKFDSKTDLAIRALCAAMKADSRVKILITGHTDNVGSAEGNMAYGKKRAEALKQLMVNQGAPASSIATYSRGQEEPVVDNDTDEHRHQNRRAVITLR